MLHIGIQFFGGRGSGGGGKGGGGGGTKSAKETKFSIPTGITKKDLKSMSRTQLETLATAIYANEALDRGKTLAQGISWAKSMMSGNSNTALINYIYKRTRK